jgi:hypothetical protein
MALPPIYPSVPLLSPSKQIAHYADGGLANYYPLKYEDPDTLGFRLLQKKIVMDQVLKSSLPFLTYLTLALDIAVSEKEIAQWNELSEKQRSNTITIICGTDLGSMDLSIQDSESSLIFKSGESAVRKFTSSFTT